MLFFISLLSIHIYPLLLLLRLFLFSTPNRPIKLNFFRPIDVYMVCLRLWYHENKTLEYKQRMHTHARRQRHLYESIAMIKNVALPKISVCFRVCVCVCAQNLNFCCFFFLHQKYKNDDSIWYAILKGMQIIPQLFIVRIFSFILTFCVIRHTNTKVHYKIETFR